MSFIDRFTNSEKYKNEISKRFPLETDFSGGEVSDSWFVSWEEYFSVSGRLTADTLRGLGSEVFIFPQNMTPKDILMQVKESLRKHVRSVIHVTQFNKL